MDRANATPLRNKNGYTKKPSMARRGLSHSSPKSDEPDYDAINHILLEISPNHPDAPDAKPRAVATT